MNCVNPYPRKVALVTGGAKRVGKSICLKLHNDGYNIVIHCRNSINEANDLKDELNSTILDSARVLSCDLSQEVAKTCESLIDSTVSFWNRLDLIVNSASIFESSQLENLTEQHWDLTLNTNLKAPVFLMKSASRHLKSTRGSIINIGDLLGEKCLPSHFSHCIAKAAVMAATRSASVALAPEVRVNAIAPGLVMWPDQETDLWTNEKYKKSVSLIPAGHSGCPEDVAEAVSFLASEKAIFISGIVLRVDGAQFNAFQN